MMGFVNINKPKGKTSHDIVAMLRRILKIKQIGHTGTLDPMATGVLPVAIGKASRLIEYLKEDKAYIAELQFGMMSDTYDIEGVVEKFSDTKITNEQIIEALKNFRGEIEQLPPAYSAVHYKGKRLYELARQGVIPDDIPKRTVFVDKIDLLEFDYETQIAKIEVECSKGTYIRSIINDLGMMLGCGAVMTGLKRTKSGLFEIKFALTIDENTSIDDIKNAIMNPLEILHFKQKELTDIEIKRIKNGQYIYTTDFNDGEFVCLKQNNKLCAVAQKDNSKSILITKKVFIQ